MAAIKRKATDFKIGVNFSYHIIVFSITLTGAHKYFNDEVIKDGGRANAVPPTKNCAPESPTFGEIAHFSPAKCNAKPPCEGTALVITVSSVPGS